MITTKARDIRDGGYSLIGSEVATAFNWQERVAPCSVLRKALSHISNLTLAVPQLETRQPQFYPFVRKHQAIVRTRLISSSSRP